MPLSLFQKKIYMPLSLSKILFSHNQKHRYLIMLSSFIYRPTSLYQDNHRTSPIKTSHIRPTPISSTLRIHENTHRTYPTKPESKNSVEITPLTRKPPADRLSVLEKWFKMVDNAINKFLGHTIHLSVDPTYNLSGNFAPVDELSPTECEVVHGTIPPCLEGVYIRNGPNPRFFPSGPHHLLDGDGMVHAVMILGGRAKLCSRYVKTYKYLLEQKTGCSIVPNVIGGMQGLGSFAARVLLFAARVIFGHYDLGKGIGVANTSLAFFGGSLFALCESDLPYAIKLRPDGDIITIGRNDFNGKLSMNMTSHPKIDPDTKEAFAFRYWSVRPYLTFFRFDANGNKQDDVPIFSMKHSSMTHDLAITQKYAIFCEIQIGVNPVNMIRGGHLVSVDTTKVPRIGIIPRDAVDESEMRWFDVPGFNILHAINAWDEKDAVVLVAPNILSLENFFERPDLIHASMERVTIDLKNGVVSRHSLSTFSLDFAMVNPTYVSKKNRYVYAAIGDQTPKGSRLMRSSGVAKLDIAVSEDMDQNEHTVATRMYGSNCFGGEPFFVARDPEDPNLEEDDGYIVSYVHNESTDESSFLVMDAQSPTLEIAAAVKLPQRVPYGLHGLFIREKDLNNI